MPRTILIVDDHDGFRARARALLEADGFDVIGEAADGESAVGRPAGCGRSGAARHQLPGLDGFAVAERLAAGADPPAVVLISSRGADAFGAGSRAAPRAGSSPRRSCRASAWPRCSSDAVDMGAVGVRGARAGVGAEG